MHLEPDDDFPRPGRALDQVFLVMADARGDVAGQMIGDGFGGCHDDVFLNTPSSFDKLGEKPLTLGRASVFEVKHDLAIVGTTIDCLR